MDPGVLLLLSLIPISITTIIIAGMVDKKIKKEIMADELPEFKNKTQLSIK